MREDLVPDVSLGTHFFSEMIELDMLYLALFPDRKDNFLDERFLESTVNVLPEILPDDSDWAHAVRVVDTSRYDNLGVFRFNANTYQQEAVCYFKKNDDNDDYS